MENQVPTKEETIQRILTKRANITSLCVESIGLFGSFARGEQTPYSDIDILVEFEPEKHTFDHFMETPFLIEDLLGRKVEVITPEGISLHIGPYILKEVERVYFTSRTLLKANAEPKKRRTA